MRTQGEETSTRLLANIRIKTFSTIPESGPSLEQRISVIKGRKQQGVDEFGTNLDPALQDAGHTTSARVSG